MRVRCPASHALRTDVPVGPGAFIGATHHPPAQGDHGDAKPAAKPPSPATLYVASPNKYDPLGSDAPSTEETVEMVRKASRVSDVPGDTPFSPATQRTVNAATELIERKDI